MLVTITGRQETFTYLVEGEDGCAEKVIDMDSLVALHKRFEDGDMTLTDEEQCLALMLEKEPDSKALTGTSASTDELIP